MSEIDNIDKYNELPILSEMGNSSEYDELPIYRKLRIRWTYDLSEIDNIDEYDELPILSEIGNSSEYDELPIYRKLIIFDEYYELPISSEIGNKVNRKLADSSRKRLILTMRQEHVQHNNCLLVPKKGDSPPSDRVAYGLLEDRYSRRAIVHLVIVLLIAYSRTEFQLRSVLLVLKKGDNPPSDRVAYSLLEDRYSRRAIVHLVILLLIAYSRTEFQLRSVLLPLKKGDSPPSDLVAYSLLEKDRVPTKGCLYSRRAIVHLVIVLLIAYSRTEFQLRSVLLVLKKGDNPPSDRVAYSLLEDRVPTKECLHSRRAIVHLVIVLLIAYSRRTEFQLRSVLLALKKGDSPPSDRVAYSLLEKDRVPTKECLHSRRAIVHLVIVLLIAYSRRTEFQLRSVLLALKKGDSPPSDRVAYSLLEKDRYSRRAIVHLVIVLLIAYSRTEFQLRSVLLVLKKGDSPPSDRVAYSLLEKDRYSRRAIVHLVIVLLIAYSRRTEFQLRSVLLVLKKGDSPPSDRVAYSLLEKDRYSRRAIIHLVIVLLIAYSRTEFQLRSVLLVLKKGDSPPSDRVAYSLLEKDRYSRRAIVHLVIVLLIAYSRTEFQLRSVLLVLKKGDSSPSDRVAYSLLEKDRVPTKEFLLALKKGDSPPSDRVAYSLLEKDRVPTKECLYSRRAIVHLVIVLLIAYSRRTEFQLRSVLLALKKGDSPPSDRVAYSLLEKDRVPTKECLPTRGTEFQLRSVLLVLKKGDSPPSDRVAYSLLEDRVPTKECLYSRRAIVHLVIVLLIAYSRRIEFQLRSVLLVLKKGGSPPSDRLAYSQLEKDRVPAGERLDSTQE
ncbi:hypothetical protein J6590_049217 [Homalodisca vitripennis]|nr:hypothetical protein J6590_049217 [Homalodisca vitripennis]